MIFLLKGDQASIVGGAIDFVKELEQLLQSLEAQKRALVQEQKATNLAVDCSDNASMYDVNSPPFAQFFSYPQYIWCHVPRDCPVPAENQPSAVADVEVTQIETHANIRIMSPHRPGQLLKMVAGLQTLRLTILHLNVTTTDAMVLYSLSVKVRSLFSVLCVLILFFLTIKWIIYRVPEQLMFKQSKRIYAQLFERSPHK
jgi:hypothetical protein